MFGPDPRYGSLSDGDVEMSPGRFYCYTIMQFSRYKAAQQDRMFFESLYDFITSVVCAAFQPQHKYAVPALSLASLVPAALWKPPFATLGSC